MTHCIRGVPGPGAGSPWPPLFFYPSQRQRQRETEWYQGTCSRHLGRIRPLADSFGTTPPVRCLRYVTGPTLPRYVGLTVRVWKVPSRPQIGDRLLGHPGFPCTYSTYLPHTCSRRFSDDGLPACLAGWTGSICIIIMLKTNCTRAFVACSGQVRITRT